VTDVVVGDAFDIAPSHGQDRMRTVQGLNLAFLIDTQHQGVVGRVQVEADDIAYLLDEKRIGRELETAAAVGLQPERLKQSMDRGFRDAAGGGGLPDTPVGSTPRFAREGTLQQGCDLLVIDAARPTGT